MTTDDADGGNENFLDAEAQADSAPVAADLAYVPRSKWRPGNCVGYIINSGKPVARVRWPKKTDKRAFFARINGRTDD